MEDYCRYLPQTEEDRRKMLDEIGAKEVRDLFESIPGDCRLTKPLKLPEPLAEPDLLKHLEAFQSPVFTGPRWIRLLGGGAYHHFIPAAVTAMISRSEFYTSY